MSTPRKGTEIFVGLFLVLGFGAIAVMAILFGKTGEGSKTSYKLTVEFPNASGLAKGANVLLSGANIGRVVFGPEIDPKTYKLVTKLAIRDDILLPRKTKFVVGSSGLLGDKYIDVQVPLPLDLSDPFKDGEYISPPPGGGAGGLAELTDKGSLVMDRLVEELEHIEKLTLRLNDGLLHERNLKNIEETFDNLKQTTTNFREASVNLEGVVTKAGNLLESTEGTIKSADVTAAQLQVAISDLRKMIASATKAVDGTSALVKRAADGEGPLGTLINDKKMAEDLKSLAANLRRSGVLFYKDKPGLATPAPTTPKPRR